MKTFTLILLLALIFSSVYAVDTVLVHSTVAIPDSVFLKTINISSGNKPFWENSTLVIGFVSIFSMAVGAFVTLFAQSKQLKNQIATTILKDWMEKVRAYTATCLVKSSIIVDYYAAYIVFQKKTPSDEVKKECIEAETQFINSQASLSVYLNFAKPLEENLYSLISELYNNYKKGEIPEVNRLIKEVQAATQKLMASKL